MYISTAYPSMMRRSKLQKSVNRIYKFPNITNFIPKEHLTFSESYCIMFQIEDFSAQQEPFLNALSNNIATATSRIHGTRRRNCPETRAIEYKKRSFHRLPTILNNFSVADGSTGYLLLYW